MSAQLAPFTAWRLTPGFRPQQVTIVDSRVSFGTTFFISESGKRFSESELFDTAMAAINHGFQRLGDQEAYIKKLMAGVAKKRKALLAAQAKMAKAGDP
jgi:hypothetical protein